LLAALVGADRLGSSSLVHHYFPFENLLETAAIEVRRQVPEDPLVAHQLEQLVGYSVAVLDGVCAGINRHLNAGRGESVDGDRNGSARRSNDWVARAEA